MQTSLDAKELDLPLDRLRHAPEQDIRILADIKKALVKTLAGRTYRLILFGSKARADFERGSDIDVAVIVDGMDRVLKRAIYDTVIEVEFEHSTFTSTLPLSTEEFQHLLSRERRIALDIQREGISL